MREKPQMAFGWGGQDATGPSGDVTSELIGENAMQCTETLGKTDWHPVPKRPHGCDFPVEARPQRASAYPKVDAERFRPQPFQDVWRNMHFDKGRCRILAHFYARV